MKLVRLLLLVGLVPGVCCAREPARAVVLSDLHFNPLASSNVLPQLMAADPKEWEAILNGDPHPPTQEYKQDSTWPLFASVVAQLKAIEPKPKVVIVTGDILPHKFSLNFPPNQDAGAFRSFVQKTITFVQLELQQAAGGAPVIYTVGNNDDECGDYALQPGGPFLEDSKTAMQKLAHLSTSAAEDWDSLGSYVVASPLAAHHRIIALNSTYLSSRYKNACGAGSSVEPGAKVLDWLSTQLEHAARDGEKVWIVYHIPPGIDGHSSAKQGKVVPLWNPVYSERFNGLLDRYSKVIELELAGHTHLDDFRLLPTPHGNSLVLINPGVSPNIGQNPAYRIITVDAHAIPQDIFTYYQDLMSGKWLLEYDSRKALKLERINAASYAALYHRIEESAQSISDWRSRYAVLRPASLDPSPGYLRSLYCATGNVNPTAFEACLTTSATSWNDIPGPH